MSLMIYVTYPDPKAAQEISRFLLEMRLVACANIFPAHRSLYHWQGQIESAEEVAVIYKTRPDLFEAVKAAIVERHSYDVPCIVAWPLTQGHGDFMRWVEAETGAE